MHSCERLGASTTTVNTMHCAHSMQGVDFTSATVTINGAPVTITSRPGDIHMPSVVFTGPAPDAFNGADLAVDVAVSVGGSTYTYTVTVFDDAHYCDVLTISGVPGLNGDYTMNHTAR